MLVYLCLSRIIVSATDPGVPVCRRNLLWMEDAVDGRFLGTEPQWIHDGKHTLLLLLFFIPLML